MYFFGDTYFQGFILKNVFQITFIIVLIIEGAILVLTTWNNRKGSKNKTKSDRGSMLAIMIGFWMAIFLNPICVTMFSFVVPVYFFWIGVVLMLIGVYIRMYSVWTLRKFFTLNVQIDNEQKIVKDGPYKYIRHPSYTGSILTLLGISISFRSPFGIIATIIISALVYGFRIQIEEKALEKSFGLSYEDYKKQTWRLIPHIW
jgi:protein-S-isoprenylcysteine O-methyltransferase Ste14